MMTARRDRWAVPGSGVRLWLFGLLLWLLAWMPLQQAAAQVAEAELMREVVMEFVAETGNSVIGVGSWLEPARFKEGISDFDMRLISADGAGTPLRQWHESKRRLVELINHRFGDRAPDVLRRTNLYAPNQLMAGVQNQQEAIARLRELGTAPNLAHRGPVSATTPVDGIWGKGGEAWRQEYERASGRFFYRNPDGTRVLVGRAHIQHRLEGYALRTADGTAQVAGQYSDMAFRALDKASAHDLAKYLQRIDQSLAQSYELSRVSMDPGFRNQILRLRTELGTNPGLLDDPQRVAEVKRLLVRAKSESAIMANYAHAGPLKRAYLKVMLDGVAAKNQVGDFIDAVGAHTPDWVNFKNAIKLMTIAAGTKATAEAAGHGDGAQAAQVALGYLKYAAIQGFSPAMLLQSLPGYSAAMLAQMIVEIRIQAEAAGVDLVAGTQDAWDLISGIYTPWGAAQDEDRRYRRHWTVADLVARFQSEERLQAFVFHMANRAAVRGAIPGDWGPLTARTEEKVAQAIFDKTWPVIRHAWLWERELLMDEYLHLRSQLVHVPLLIGYAPQPVGPGERLVASVHSPLEHPQQLLGRMEEILRLLFGSGSYIAANYFWTPEGSGEGVGALRRAFTFPAPGRYPVEVRVSFTPYPGGRDPRGFRSDSLMVTRMLQGGEVDAMVEVDVIGDHEPATDPCQWLAEIDANRYVLLQQDLPEGFTQIGGILADSRFGGLELVDSAGQVTSGHFCSLVLRSALQLDLAHATGVDFMVGITDDHERAAAWARRDVGPFLTPGGWIDWWTETNDIGDARIPGNGGSLIHYDGIWAVLVHRNRFVRINLLGTSSQTREANWATLRRLAVLWLDKVSRVDRDAGS